MRDYTGCIFCGGDRDDPEHEAYCDGRQGLMEEAIEAAIPEAWIPPLPADPAALDGLTAEALAAILAAVTPEMVRALVATLSPAPRHVDEIRRALADEPWFPSHASRDTQLRRIRTVRDGAVAYGYPVCSTNHGYALGDWEAVYKSAERARRFAHGAYVRATVLERLAERMARDEEEP